MVKNVDDDTPDPLPHPEHPLFPVEEGQKVPDISYISIYRKEGGSMVSGPTYPANEIQTTDHIAERFGGGLYEIVGRRANVNFMGLPGSVCRRKLITLPGRPKVFSNEPTMQEKIAAGLTPDPTEVKPAEPKGAMGDSNVLVALLSMQQQSNQTFMTMMLEMMKSGKSEATEQARRESESSKEFTKMMMATSGQNMQTMMTMMTAMMGNRGGGAEEFQKYAELLKTLGFGPSKPAEDKKEDESVGDILSNVADIVAGAPAALNALKEATSNGSGIPLGHQVGEAVAGALPGSAASVLAGNRS